MHYCRAYLVKWRLNWGQGNFFFILDELKHIIGSETTRRGLLTIFELFQRPILNRRLLYVLLEGVLCTLFPEKDMFKLFQKLHSKSKRIQDKNNTQNIR